ncbi:MAG: BON domain-containing protein, partial [Terriglobales bacterium]
MAKRYVSMLAVLALLAVAVGCSSQPNDTQITSEVQAKLFADPNISGKQIYVNTQGGVVTLTGNVPTDMERAAAGNDASQVKGVKTVVNNLLVMPVVAAVEPESAKPSPVVETRREPVRRAAARASAPAPVYTPAAAPVAAPPAPVPVVAAKPAPPPPVTIAAGTRISIRTIDPIDTSTNQLGDTFRATLESPLMVED